MIEEVISQLNDIINTPVGTPSMAGIDEKLSGAMAELLKLGRTVRNIQLLGRSLTGWCT